MGLYTYDQSHLDIDVEQTHFRDLALVAQVPHKMSTSDLTLLYVKLSKQRPQTLAESHICILPSSSVRLAETRVKKTKRNSYKLNFG